ncbi:acetyl/propionyl/methylcrotonyl-CoA carboxylase subunit alpha [Microbulbifer sp. VAAC004]|uniref:Acetyl-CoA carboxylase biotin carboxylase subunit n=1 Tax=Microbulbifer variabilis TaxID=266805 RepID=A0ABY4VGM4_9GAMM|nr:acetyl-CoA carboxylase biotin carboxylase subunit [Microbulbifer variabilis]USD23339.1 acetyl-CoA carboxylase biotin carboxylase subunit [Microbulbifer variabilis]
MSTTETLLIANRGEIALRIMRTARAEGYRTVAVYSDADCYALHAQTADIAVPIGGQTSAESYLDIQKILAAAKKSGATAVHPGYGFLAENAEFASACEENGLSFVGPSAEVIELMGNKRKAKEFVAAAGVPCIPGFQGAQDDDTLIAEARRIGFPLMIKAAAGGGGRGMRLAHGDSELASQLRAARSESMSAFGSDELILEKALVNARHIEIQVFADRHGNCIHLGERDCSVQRRHQKVVEECPSPAVDTQLRERMGQAAVDAARACGYLGAGTVEFLLCPNGEFYFLEMNTRLQVEHAVTEMVTGFDLVAWQLAVARGEALCVSQQQVTQQGHAIEVRLYAEDPEQQFLPQAGKVLHWKAPKGQGIRIDHALKSGCEITPFYDPMLGKLIAWGQDREEARRKLTQSLSQLEFIGPKNNIHFLQKILAESQFIAGDADTSFLDQNSTLTSVESVPAVVAAQAALLNHLHQANPQDRRSGRSDWRSGDNSVPTNYRLEISGQTLNCELLVLVDHSYQISVGEQQFLIQWVHFKKSQKESGLYSAELLLDGVSQKRLFQANQSNLHLLLDGRQFHFVDITHAPAKSSFNEGSGRITAPMDGCLVQVLVEPNQSVQRGDTIALMEAMKMEHALRADRDGTVIKLGACEGDQVRGGQLLVQIEDTPTETAKIPSDATS